jgi:hypothetical protein
LYVYSSQFKRRFSAAGAELEDKSPPFPQKTQKGVGHPQGYGRPCKRKTQEHRQECLCYVDRGK